MRKSAVNFIRSFVAVLLIASIVTPTQIESAGATGTITKTITVLGPDGQPYSGAKVVVVYQSQSGALDRTSFSATATSDNNGVATVSFPNSAINGSIFAQSRSGDTLTAAAAAWDMDYANSNDATISLQKADFSVNILNFDGTDAPVRSAIWGEDTDYKITLRTGAFGVAALTDATSGGCRMFQAIPADGTQNNFFSTYGTKIIGTGTERIVKVYSDYSTCNVEAPKINGVYQLRFLRGNVSGTLLSENGQPLSFDESQGYEVNSYPLNQDGSRKLNVDGSWGFAGLDGAWSTYIDTSTPGKYEIAFSGYGNDSFPAFSEEYVWVTSDHKLSWTENGSGSDSLTRNVNVPAQNVVFKFSDSRTSLSLPAFYQLRKMMNNAFIPYSYVAPANGSASFSIPDGIYKLLVRDINRNNTNEYNISVSGSSITVTDSNNRVLNKDNGIYKTFREPSNMYVRIKDSAGNPVSGFLDFCNQSGCNGHIEVGASGLGDATVSNGDYNFVRIASPASSTLASIYSSATVQGGVATINIDNNPNITHDGDFWVFTLPTANLKVKATNPINGSVITRGNISFDSVDDSWNPTGNVGNADFYDQRPGMANAYLPDGKYLMTLYLDPNDSSNDGLANKSYQVTVVSGTATVKYNGVTVNLTNGFFPITAQTSNLDLAIKNLAGQPLTDGWVDACVDLGNGDTGSCRGFGFNETGLVSMSLANGSWVIVVRPGSSITNMAPKSYSVSVTGGVATVSGLTAENGRWILTGTPPNLTGSFTLQSGSIDWAHLGNNQGISLDLQKYNNGNWEYQNNGSWVRSANFAVNVSAQGRYRLVATPRNFSDLVQSYSAEFWVNGSSKLSTSQGGTYSDSLTAFNIQLKAPNLKLKVVNPADSTLLPGGWVTIEKVDGQSRSWVSNADISPSTPGITGANLTDVGQYVLTVNPPNGNGAIVGLASRQYQLTVAANDSMTVTSDGAPVVLDGGRWVLSPATANVTARILKPDGTPFVGSNGMWINANIQKFNDGNNNWEWTSVWANGDQDGYVSLRLNAAGKYRLRVQPSGDPDVTVTYSPEFTIASNELSTFKKDFGSITLVGPSIKISVATSGSPSVALNYSGIEIRKDGNQIDWADTQRSGVAGISLKSEGIYEFIVNPPQDLQGTTARKSYKVNAVKNGDGVITATAVAGTGVSVNNGVTTLLLGAPTLSGTVLAPTGSTTQANSQVYAYNVSTGQEMWEYSTNTNNSGAWAMTLPAGTYKIFAKTPWGTSTYGGSDGVGNVVVDSSGSVTVPVGMSANAFTIRLKNPTWSGVVKNPAGTAPVPNARVCLRLNNVFNCVNADSNGQWAMSAPSTFTNFTGTNPYLEINDDYGRQYPQKRFDGVTAVNGAIGTSGTNINLQFSDANTQIVVTAGGQPVSNVWVTAERDGVGWLGGGNTNASGVAKLDIADLTSEFRVRIELNGNPTVASAYATTMKTFALGDITGGTSGGVFTGNVALAEPNFKVALFEPTSDGSVGNPVPYSWIELINESTGMWIGGSGTDANGFASFKLDVPQSDTNKFLVNVNPSWNSSTNFSRQSYSVSVSSSSTVSVVNKVTTTAVTTSSVNGRTVYPLTLGNPTVTGFVVDPSGNGVANSWVVPIDAITNEYYGQQSTSSRNNGAIGLNLGNGTYKLEANVPWGTSDLAKSAQCSITVASGTISTGGACVQSGTPKTVQLALRSPNLTFTLKIDGSVVANANVGIGSGKWFTNAQSDSNGRVSLFVDADAIRTLNNYTTVQPLNVWVDPPYGGTVTMARWDCQSTQAKPICSGLVNIPATGDYPTTALGDVTGVSPNTRVRVVAPGTSTPLPNSWVTVQAFDPAHPEYGTRWLGGGNSNSNGYVSMNLDTSTVQSGWKYLIEINAPWNQREIYATNLDTNSGNGYTWSEITSLSSKSPATPNLTITVSASDASANKFGWIGVEEVNGTNVPQKWVGGYGLNENALTSVYLAASKRFKITAYPGPGKSGARTVCIVATNSSAVVSAVPGQCGAGTFTSGAVTIALDGGNIVGAVKNGTTPLVGAIVYANTTDKVDETTAIITSTGVDGRYGLQLDSSKTWNIKVFPTGAGSESLSTGGETGVVPPSTGSATHDFTIAAR